MKTRKISTIETPYSGIGETDYQKEKRRLQIELLKIQQRVVRKGSRMAIVFEGRDAAHISSVWRSTFEMRLCPLSNM